MTSAFPISFSCIKMGGYTLKNTIQGPWFCRTHLGSSTLALCGLLRRGKEIPGKEGWIWDDSLCSHPLYQEKYRQKYGGFLQIVPLTVTKRLHMHQDLYLMGENKDRPVLLHSIVGQEMSEMVLQASQLIRRTELSFNWRVKYGFRQTSIFHFLKDYLPSP